MLRASTFGRIKEGTFGRLRAGTFGRLRASWAAGGGGGSGTGRGVVRLHEIFRFEVEYRLRSPSTWIYGGILFLIAIWMLLATADGGPGSHFNAPERLAGASVIVGMFGLLVTAGIFGDAAVRDTHVGMEPLLFTTPLRKAEYLGGRFLAHGCDLIWVKNAGGQRHGPGGDPAGAPGRHETVGIP